MEEKKESFLFKKLDLAFVYLFIFIVGIVIVEFTDESLVTNNSN